MKIFHWVWDERPFEHEFFIKIAQSFPFVEKLSLLNHEPQQNNNQHFLITKYSHLTQLDLVGSHEDYVEQFLNNTKTCLLNNIYLRMTYETLRKVTDDFTSNVTRVNCSKIIGLVLYGKLERPELKDYFPHAKIY